jgi:hypothetical protein
LTKFGGAVPGYDRERIQENIEMVDLQAVGFEGGSMKGETVLM